MDEIINEILNECLKPVKNVANEIVDRKRLKNKLINIGNNLCKHEQSEKELDLRIVFSEDNMEELANGLQEISAGMYADYIDNKLKRLFERIDIESDRAEFYIISFKEMLCEDFCRDEKQNRGIIMLLHQLEETYRKEGQKNCADLKKEINRLYLMISSYTKSSSDYNTVKEEISTEKPKNGEINNIYWNLSTSYKCETKQTNSERMELLISTWRAERKKYPGWYIVPSSYREKLKYYTRGEELLSEKSDISNEKRMDFLYELTWRKERAFISASDYYLRQALNVWESNTQPEEMEANEHWCFVGIFLLKQYREKMDWANWKSVYDIMNTKPLNNKIKEELFVEKIYAELFKMNLSKVLVDLHSIELALYSYANQLKLISLMAETGISFQALTDIDDLCKHIESKLEENMISSNDVIYLKSLMACVWHLKGFLLQAIKGIEDKVIDQVKQCYQKKDELEDYFSFQEEKNYCIHALFRWHEKKTPKYLFALNRELETIVSSSNDWSEEYGFYKILEETGLPMRLGHVGLIGDFEESLLEVSSLWNNKIFWLWLVRSGNSKLVERCLTRSRLISWDRETKNQFFEYIYHAVWDNLDNICCFSDSWKYGNIFTAIITTCSEAVARMASVTDMGQQKRILKLMTVLIDRDAIREFRKMDGFIYTVMHSVSNESKALMMNTLLECSTKEREHFENDFQTDPFDVFDYNEQSREFFEKSKVDLYILDNLLEMAQKTDTERRNACARLGQLSTFGVLTEEQNQKFGEILWNHINPNNGLPDMEHYYYFVFLDWPVPEGIDVNLKIQKTLVEIETKQDIREEFDIHSYMPSNYMNQIIGYNTHKRKCWQTTYLELIFELLFKNWKYIQKQSVDIYYDIEQKNFIRRGNQLIRVFESFSIEDIRNLSVQTKKNLKLCLDEIKKSGIATYEADLLILEDSDTQAFAENLVEGLYSSNREISISASRAIERYITRINDKYKWYLFEELLKVIRSRKEPGLQAFIISAYNVFYRNTEQVPGKIVQMVEKTLMIIAEQTDYQGKKIEEDELKKKLEIRSGCAGLAYQLYCYENSYVQNDIHSDATILWKEICVGEKSSDEFSEVKNEWGYERS